MERNRTPSRTLELDELLHPARAFQHPSDVVRDPDLTLNEKRAILSSWASDACALEAAHDLRLSATGAQARWDDIMDALRALDRQSDPPEKPYDPKIPWWKQIRVRRRRGNETSSGAQA